MSPLEPQTPTGPSSYRTLNDASWRCPELAPGPTRILYRRRDGGFVELGSVASEDLERLFWVLQGEVWSPGGEARALVSSLGAKHTSISVGDRIALADGRLFEVAPVGFVEIDRPPSL